MKNETWKLSLKEPKKKRIALEFKNMLGIKKTENDILFNHHTNIVYKHIWNDDTHALMRYNIALEMQEKEIDILDEQAMNKLDRWIKENQVNFFIYVTLKLKQNNRLGFSLDANVSLFKQRIWQILLYKNDHPTKVIMPREEIRFLIEKRKLIQDSSVIVNKYVHNFGSLKYRKQGINTKTKNVEKHRSNFFRYTKEVLNNPLLFLKKTNTKKHHRHHRNEIFDKKNWEKEHEKFITKLKNHDFKDRTELFSVAPNSTETFSWIQKYDSKQKRKEEIEKINKTKMLDKGNKERLFKLEANRLKEINKIKEMDIQFYKDNFLKQRSESKLELFEKRKAKLDLEIKIERERLNHIQNNLNVLEEAKELQAIHRTKNNDEENVLGLAKKLAEKQQEFDLKFLENEKKLIQDREEKIKQFEAERARLQQIKIEIQEKRQFDLKKAEEEKERKIALLNKEAKELKIKSDNLRKEALLKEKAIFLEKNKIFTEMVKTNGDSKKTITKVNKILNSEKLKIISKFDEEIKTIKKIAEEKIAKMKLNQQNKEQEINKMKIFNKNAFLEATKTLQQQNLKNILKRVKYNHDYKNIVEDKKKEEFISNKKIFQEQNKIKYNEQKTGVLYNDELRKTKNQYNEVKLITDSSKHVVQTELQPKFKESLDNNIDNYQPWDKYVIKSKIKK